MDLIILWETNCTCVIFKQNTYPLIPPSSESRVEINIMLFAPSDDVIYPVSVLDYVTMFCPFDHQMASDDPPPPYGSQIGTFELSSI